MSDFIMEMCNGVVTGVDSYLARAEAAGMLHTRGPPLGWGQSPVQTPSSYHQQQHQPHQMGNAAPYMASASVGMHSAPMGMNSPLMDGFAARASQTMYHAQQAPNGMGHYPGYSAPSSASIPNPSTNYPMPHAQGAPSNMRYSTGYQAGVHAHYQPAQSSFPMHQAQQVPRGASHNHAATGNAGQAAAGMGARMYSPFQQAPQGMGPDSSTAAPRSPDTTSKSKPRQASPSSSGLDQGSAESQYTTVHTNSMRASAAAHQADSSNAVQRSTSLAADARQLTTHASLDSDASSGGNPRRPSSAWPSRMSSSGVSAAQLDASQPASHTSSPPNSYSGAPASQVRHPPRVSHCLQQASLQLQQPQGMTPAGLDQASPSAQTYSNAEAMNQPQPYMGHPGQQMSRAGQQSAAMLNTWDAAQQQPDIDPQQTRRPSQTRHQAQQMGYPTHCMPANNWGNGPSGAPGFLAPHQVSLNGLQMPGLAQAMSQMSLDQGLGGRRAPSAR